MLQGSEMESGEGEQDTAGSIMFRVLFQTKQALVSLRYLWSLLRTG